MSDPAFVLILAALLIGMVFAGTNYEDTNPPLLVLLQNPPSIQHRESPRILFSNQLQTSRHKAEEGAI
jgi:hypothetical protein